MWGPSIGVARGGQSGHGPPKFLENLVILCFERGFSKQNSVIRLKSNILAPQSFGLAAPLGPSAEAQHWNSYKLPLNS